MTDIQVTTAVATVPAVVKAGAHLEVGTTEATIATSLLTVINEQFIWDIEVAVCVCFILQNSMQHKLMEQLLKLISIVMISLPLFYSYSGPTSPSTLPRVHRGTGVSLVIELLFGRMGPNNKYIHYLT